MTDIIGSKGGGDQHVHYEATDSLHSTSFARVLDLISEGEILGLSHGMKSIYLNGTPLQNADGTNNFKDVSVDFRSGTQAQDYIAGFPDVENEIAVGVELRSTAAWTHAITNLTLSALRLTLSVPQLSKSDTTNGDILGYKIDYQIELSTDGAAYAVVLSNSFNGKTTTPYQRSARIDLPAATTGWSIRVTRLTANANTSAIADTTTIVSYTEVIDAKLRYPMCALVGVQVDAKQFQNVPTRSYDMYGRIIQVPTNYDPVARTYTGVWDGTLKPAWTSNPAWIFRDLVLNDRYGLGNRITSAQIDKWALYAIAKYCDEMVSDGQGGTEPRFTCNLYLQTQKQAYAVLQDMASVFRGISYWGGGSIIPTADMPSDPVYIYTAANVIDGKFSRVGSSKKTRFTVALVSWNDPADMYKAKVEYVEDQQGIQRYGIQQFSMTAFGCTSQGQAQRAGRWALATSRLETGMISFDVGMDGAIALPGQIIRVADPSRMGRRTGGRVHTAVGRTVTLDKAPTINVGDKLTVILPAGTSETHNVASISGDDVTIDADWTTLPVAQSVWSVDSTTLAAPTFKVISITEKTGGNIFTITASQHEPGKYALVDSGTAISTRPQTSIDVSMQAAPASVTIAAYTVSLNDVQKLAMSVSCAAVVGATGYEGAYKKDNGNWIPIPRQSSPTVDIVDVLAGTYSAKLCAVNSIGVTSVETLSADTAISKTVDSMYNAASRVSNCRVYAYQRAASAPTGSPGDVTVTFASNSITYPAALLNGWVRDIPSANGNPLYVTAISGAGAGATVNLLSASWSAAAVMAQDGPGGTGTNGTNGLNSATITIYQRSASATPLTLPSADTTYTFATGVLAGLNNGWVQGVPAHDATKPFLQGSIATAVAAAATDTVSATEWSTAQVMARDGASGRGATLNIDPSVEDSTKWVTTGSPIGIVGGAGAAGAVGANWWQSTSCNNSAPSVTEVSTYTIDPSRTYSLTANFYAESGSDRTVFLFIEFYDASGTHISTSWGGSFSGYAFSGTLPTAQFSRQGSNIGAGTAKLIPSNTRACKIGAIIQHPATGSSTTTQQGVQDFRLVDITDVVAAQAAANAAQVSADAANALAADTASDSMFTPSEKQAWRATWNTWISEKAGINATSAIYSATSAENTAYNSAIQAFGTYLNAGTAYTLSTSTPPLWVNDANLSVTVAIVGSTFRSNVQALTDARQALVNKINVESGKVALWSNIAGQTNAPANNATVGADWATNVAGAAAVNSSITTAGTTATWGGVTGDGKAGDNATVGPADAATALGFNPQFSAWPAGSTYPTGWGGWAGTPAKETTTTRTPPNAVKWTASGDMGMKTTADFHTAPQAVGNYLRGSFDVNITSNNGGTCRPGYYIVLYTNSGLTTSVVTIVPATAGVLGWQRVPFTASVGSTQQIYGMDIYQMCSWTSMAGGASTTGSICIFDNLTFDFVQQLTPAQTAPSGMAVSGLADIDSQGNTNTGSYVSVDTQTASAAGGVGPYTYAFSLSMNGFLKMTTTSTSFTITAKGTNTQSNGAVTCTAVDSGGRTFVETIYVSVGFGTGVPA